MEKVTEYIISPQSGKAFFVKANQLIKITDLEGQQTGDFFALVSSDPTEYLSAGVTIDCNSNIYLKEKDFLYSNKYNKLLQIEEDQVGTHDLLHPTCSQRSYEMHYGVDKPHPSCHHNLHDSLEEFKIEYKNLLTVFNFFMNSRVDADGKIIYNKTISKPGNFIVLRAYTDLIVAITACSLTQSAINNFSAKPLKVEIIGSSGHSGALRSL
jgi:uncharacterized protein YcgI (DUF1989 family)